MGAKININEFTKRHLGEPYELGKVDCFSIIYKYLQDCGLSLKNSFKHVTLETYKDIYVSNRKYAIKLMEDFISSELNEVNPKFIRVGDIILLSYHGIDSLGISIGQGMFISAIPKLGVVAISRDFYVCRRAWSWPR